jgi:N-acetylmuramoyl-L-alanine amidase
MAFAVKTHVLFQDDKSVAQRKTPNMGGALVRPSLLVMHFTASQRAAGAISWLCNPAAKASAQIVIDIDGTVTQLMPLNRIAWHAGLSKWKGKSGCNSFSIGIELANPGLLRRLGNDKFADAYGHSVPAAQVATVNGRHWALYPKAQQDAAVGVAQAIIAAYPTIREIVGHSDIAPGRKIDPGDAWPMESFRSKVFGRK